MQHGRRGGEKRPLMGAAIVLMASGVALSTPSRGEVSPLPTMSGPETREVINRATGCVIMDRPVGGIIAIRLRTLEEIVVQAPRVGYPAITAVGGPDDEGWVIFVEDHMEPQSHTLKAIKLDGTGAKEIFTRPGSTIWDHPIGTPALAPRGGRIAVLTQPPATRRPFAPPIVTGPLEIWNIAEKTGRETGITALNRGLSWFPDGKRLAYVEPGDPVMVSILDVETGERRPLHKGMNPIVSTDGASVLVNAARDGNLLIDVGTGASRRIDWPGNWRGPVALLGGDLLLYRGLPTAGTPAKLTEHNSPFVGPKATGSLKLAELASGRFLTVVSDLDPRSEISFGIANSCR